MTDDRSFLRRHAYVASIVLGSCLIVVVALVVALLARPELRSVTARDAVVPTVVDLPGLEAEQRLDDAGFDQVLYFDLRGEETPPARLDVVVRQYPRGEETLPVDAPVFVVGIETR